MLEPRQHIQNHSDHSGSRQLHWGYADRVVPCTNDAGSCEYLDAVYWMHDIGMIYSAIMWAVTGGVFLLWFALRMAKPKSQVSTKDSEAAQATSQNGLAYRTYRSLATIRQRWFLADMWPRVFGHVSRLQVTILAIISAYLLIFSLVGIVYRTWITPIKGLPGVYNTRTGLGGFSDRVGVLAYALTPLTVALASRESIISLITGIPYQHFNFLHRWTGRIIFVQSALHTIGWTIIEAKLYQPQPKVYTNFIKQQYMVFGCVAFLFICFMFVFSLRPVIRWTGYEFFRKTHYIAALLYIGACWGHWTKLACWMIPSLILFFIDRGLRLARTALIHYGKKDGSKGIGFRAAQASLTTFSDGEADVVRMEFEHNHGAWKIGQHFFLCFPDLTIWQSHPFTPSSMPRSGKKQKHMYIARAMKGETRRLADLALAQPEQSTPVILSGPYGKGVSGEGSANNVLTIAGGTGISFTLPIVFDAINEAKTQQRFGAIELVWIIRKTQNVEWIAPELALLRSHLQDNELDLRIKIFVTRDSDAPSRCSSSENSSSDQDPGKKEAPQTTITSTPRKLSSTVSDFISDLPGFSIEWLANHHPRLNNGDGSSLLEEWLERSLAHGGRNQVFASGPPGLGADLRTAVAAKNDVRRTWRGDESGDVGFYWDDRFA